jgi:hypothetical protein
VVVELRLEIGAAVGLDPSPRNDSFSSAASERFGREFTRSTSDVDVRHYPR